VQRKSLLLEKGCSPGSAAGLLICLDLSQTDAGLLDGQIVCKTWPEGYREENNLPPLSPVLVFQ